MKSYNLGLYEKSMPESFSVEEKLTLAKSAGFDFMEISIDETDRKMSRIFDKDLRREIINAKNNSGMPIKTMCLSGHRKYPLGSEDEAVRKKSLEIMEAAIDFSLEVGIRIIQLAGYDVYYTESNERTAAYFVEGLAKCAETASRAGVMLGFETMETPFMNTAEKAKKYVDIINSPYLKIYPDIGNITNGTDDYLGDLRAVRGDIIAAHLKETKPGVFRDLEFGQGRVDFDGCIKELLSQGVRIFNLEFWYDGVTDPFEYVTRNKNYVEKIFAGN
ncbi:MAG: L-ribulose-5-phosphate 3-epimerase [Clostridia bacterium]|nr:L-ribulose-5-phosphate 3-epimerase [Clostridia bacterium]